MRLKSATVRNFRCFDELEVQFHPRLTVLVAENGGDKTALLDAIAIGLTPLLTHLYFHSTGAARVRDNGAGMNEAELLRARETIRVFNLNSARLESARARAVEQYLKKQPGIVDDLQALSPEDRRAYVERGLAETRWDAHSTFIKHLLEGCLG